MHIQVEMLDHGSCVCLNGPTGRFSIARIRRANRTLPSRTTVGHPLKNNKYKVRSWLSLKWSSFIRSRGQPLDEEDVDAAPRGSGSTESAEAQNGTTISFIVLPLQYL